MTTGRRSSISHQVARARLVVGRARMYSPDVGMAKAARLAWQDRKGATGEIHLEWPGYGSPFYLRAGGSDLLTFHQVIARDGYEMPFPIGEPDVVLDAGANIGMSSIWYANRYPRAKVLAIEPEQGNFAQLLRNCAPYPNIVALQGALWPTEGTLRISDTSVGSFAFRTEPVESTPRASDGPDHDATNDVAAFTVSGLMSAHGLSRIGVLKIDIEGSEKELFEGDTSWLEHVDAIAIELHDRFKPGCREAFDRVAGDFTRRATIHDETFAARPTVAAPDQVGT